MRGNTVPIEVSLKRGKMAKTIPLYQYDYGQKLIFTDLELPSAYEVHFSNELHGKSITMIGDSTGVEIPDQYLVTGLPVYLWLFLHDGLTDGETEYAGVIPVIARAEPSDDEPTPAQQSAIETAIALLNEAREEIPGEIDTAVDNAMAEAEERIEGDIEDAEAWAKGTRNGTDVSSTDPAYHNNSKYYSEQAAVSGAAQVALVEAAGTTQVGNVNTAGTTQVGLVNTAGTTQVAAVEAKGEETLESIPEDYTTLSNDVTNLKSAIEYKCKIGVNKWNPSTVQTDKTINNSSSSADYGEVVDGSGYYTTDYIDVEDASKVSWFYNTDGTASSVVSGSMFRVAQYNENKEVISVSGNWQSSPFSLDSNTKYIRIVLNANRALNMVVFDTEDTSITYVPYEETHLSGKIEGIKSDNTTITSINKWNPSEESRDSNISTANATKGDIVSGQYNVSGFIPASKGNKITFYYSNASASGDPPNSMNVGASAFRMAEYAKDGTCLLVTANWASMPYEVQNENTYYIRCATGGQYNWNMLTVNDADIRQKPFVAYKPNLNLQTDNAEEIANIKNKIEVLSNPAEVILPSHIYGVTGQQINIYKENLMLNNRLKSLAYIHTRMPNNAIQDDFRTIWNPSTDELSESERTWEIMKYGLTVVDKKTITVCSVPKNTGNSNIKVLIIGDSKVDNGFVSYHFLHNFDDDEMTCTLLGSKYDWNTNNRNEGWGGKTAKWFCEDSNSPLSKDGECNFANYLETYSIDTPSHVFINLGTNDCASLAASTTTYLTEFVYYITQMIESIHSVNANIDVIIGLCEGCATTLDTGNADFLYWDLNQKISNLHKATIEAFDNRQDEHIWVCPMYMGMDLTQDYAMTEYPLSQRDADVNNGQGNGKTRMQINDRVHQSEVGYWKNADYMYALVKYIVAKSS